MLCKPCLIEIPQVAEAPIPEVEAPVRRKNADHLEQIVEGRRSYSQKRVAGRSQPDLLRTILEDQPKAAIGHWLTKNAQVIAVGEDPVFLDRFLG